MHDERYLKLKEERKGRKSQIKRRKAEEEEKE